MKNLSKKIIYGFGAVFIVLSAFFIWAFLIEPNRLIVNTYPIKLKNWSANLNGLKVAVIADVHGGSNFINEAKIREIVALTNAQDVDVILLLGDYISRQTFNRSALNMPIETAVENLRGLKAKYGIYAVIGNQDNQFGNEIMRKALENIGYRVLDGETATVEIKGEKLRLVGIPDALRGNASLNFNKIKASLAEHTAGKIIAFSHNPDVIWTITQKALISPDLALFVGGHTHGGQLNFPIIGAPFVPTNYGQKYAQGHFQDKDTDIFISSGIGTSGIPARFRVPPEISILEISSK